MATPSKANQLFLPLGEGNSGFVSPVAPPKIATIAQAEGDGGEGVRSSQVVVSSAPKEFVSHSVGDIFYPMSPLQTSSPLPPRTETRKHHTLILPYLRKTKKPRSKTPNPTKGFRNLQLHPAHTMSPSKRFSFSPTAGSKARPSSMGQGTKRVVPSPQRPMQHLSMEVLMKRLSKPFSPTHHGQRKAPKYSPKHSNQHPSPAASTFDAELREEQVPVTPVSYAGSSPSGSVRRLGDRDGGTEALLLEPYRGPTSGRGSPPAAWSDRLSTGPPTQRSNVSFSPLNRPRQLTETSMGGPSLEDPSVASLAESYSDTFIDEENSLAANNSRLGQEKSVSSIDKASPTSKSESGRRSPGPGYKPNRSRDGGDTRLPPLAAAHSNPGGRVWPPPDLSPEALAALEDAEDRREQRAIIARLGLADLFNFEEGELFNPPSGRSSGSGEDVKIYRTTAGQRQRRSSQGAIHVPNDVFNLLRRAGVSRNPNELGFGSKGKKSPTKEQVEAADSLPSPSDRESHSGKLSRRRVRHLRPLASVKSFSSMTGGSSKSLRGNGAAAAGPTSILHRASAAKARNSPRAILYEPKAVQPLKLTEEGLKDLTLMMKDQCVIKKKVMILSARADVWYRKYELLPPRSEDTVEPQPKKPPAPPVEGVLTVEEKRKLVQELFVEWKRKQHDELVKTKRSRLAKFLSYWWLDPAQVIPDPEQNPGVCENNSVESLSSAEGSDTEDEDDDLPFYHDIAASPSIPARTSISYTDRLLRSAQKHFRVNFKDPDAPLVEVPDSATDMPQQDDALGPVDDALLKSYLEEASRSTSPMHAARRVPKQGDAAAKAPPATEEDADAGEEDASSPSEEASTYSDSHPNDLVDPELRSRVETLRHQRAQYLYQLFMRHISKFHSHLVDLRLLRVRGVLLTFTNVYNNQSHCIKVATSELAYFACDERTGGDQPGARVISDETKGWMLPWDTMKASTTMQHYWRRLFYPLYNRVSWRENYPHFSRVIYRTGRKIRRRGLSRPLYMLLCVRIMTRKVYDSRYSMYLPPGTLLSEDTLLRRRQEVWTGPSQSQRANLLAEAFIISVAQSQPNHRRNSIQWLTKGQNKVKQALHTLSGDVPTNTARNGSATYIHPHEIVFLVSAQAAGSNSRLTYNVAASERGLETLLGMRFKPMLLSDDIATVGRRLTECLAMAPDRESSWSRIEKNKRVSDIREGPPAGPPPPSSEQPSSSSSSKAAAPERAKPVAKPAKPRSARNAWAILRRSIIASMWTLTFVNRLKAVVPRKGDKQ